MDWFTNLLVSNLAETIVTALVVPLLFVGVGASVRKLGWEVSTERLDTLEKAAVNRAGLFVNALKRGAEPRELAAILAELAVDMLTGNPKAARGTRMTAGQAAEKILAKVPQIAPDVIVPVMPSGAARVSEPRR